MSIRRSFRLVCSPDEIPLVEALLHAEGYDMEPDPFFPFARRLTSEPQPLGRSLAAFFGRIYIQDRASMLPPIALNPPKGASVLDMCASPGSKTSQLATLVGETGFVLGNEPNPSRLATLRRNLQTLDLPQAATCCQKGEALPLPDASWDFIQLDPPCSGWGTEERHPGVRDIWKDANIEPLARIQRALLREANRLLRPGGTVVYSTCTTNPVENEEQVAFARRELDLELEALAPVTGFDLAVPKPEAAGTWLLEPKPGDTQGFFVARLHKPGTSGPREQMDAAAEMTAKTLVEAEKPLEYAKISDAELRSLGIDPGALPVPLGLFGGSLHAVPPQALSLPAKLHWQGLYCGKAGKNGELRLSPRFRHGAMLEKEGAALDLEGAEGVATLRALLQGQSLPVPPGMGEEPLVRWNGLPLARFSARKGRLMWVER